MFLILSSCLDIKESFLTTPDISKVSPWKVQDVEGWWTTVNAHIDSDQVLLAQCIYDTLDDCLDRINSNHALESIMIDFYEKELKSESERLSFNLTPYSGNYFYGQHNNDGSLLFWGESSDKNTMVMQAMNGSAPNILQGGVLDYPLLKSNQATVFNTDFSQITTTTLTAHSTFLLSRINPIPGGLSCDY